VGLAAAAPNPPPNPLAAGVAAGAPKAPVAAGAPNAPVTVGAPNAPAAGAGAAPKVAAGAAAAGAPKPPGAAPNPAAGFAARAQSSAQKSKQATHRKIGRFVGGVEAQRRLVRMRWRVSTWEHQREKELSATGSGRERRKHRYIHAFHLFVFQAGRQSVNSSVCLYTPLQHLVVVMIVRLATILGRAQAACYCFFRHVQHAQTLAKTAASTDDTPPHCNAEGACKAHLVHR